MTIGYFRQDVGEYSGRTVLEETKAGAGELDAKVRSRVAELFSVERLSADLESLYRHELARTAR